MRETYGNDTEDLGMEVDTCAGIPRYPAGNKTDGNDDNTDPAVETTIHDRIARSLFRNLPHAVTRPGGAALIEGYNSQAHPRHLIKIEHPTEADDNIEATVARIEILQRALKDAGKLHDELDGATWESNDEQLRDEGSEKLEKASHLLKGARKMTEVLVTLLVRDLQSNGAAGSEDFAEIGQKAKEIEDSWIGQIRQILSQVSQMCKDMGAARVNTDVPEEFKNMPFSLDILKMDLMFLHGEVFTPVPMHAETVNPKMRTALEIVVEYPKAELKTLARKSMEKIVHESQFGKMCLMNDDMIAEPIARHLLEISTQNLEIDATVLEFSRRIMARIRGTETERDLALRRMMEKEVQFDRYRMIIYIQAMQCGI